MSPGPVSDRNPGPPEDSPYVPHWCYPDNKPLVCACGHHEGYHNDAGQCLHAHHFTKCGCAGYVAPATATPQDSTSPTTSPRSAATAAIGPPTDTSPTPVSADARSHKAPTREE